MGRRSKGYSSDRERKSTEEGQEGTRVKVRKRARTEEGQEGTRVTVRVGQEQ